MPRGKTKTHLSVWKPDSARQIKMQQPARWRLQKQHKLGFHHLRAAANRETGSDWKWKGWRGSVCNLMPLSTEHWGNSWLGGNHWPVWGKVSKSTRLMLKRPCAAQTAINWLWVWILFPLFHLHSLPRSTESGQLDTPSVWGLCHNKWSWGFGSQNTAYLLSRGHDLAGVKDSTDLRARSRSCGFMPFHVQLTGERRSTPEFCPRRSQHSLSSSLTVSCLFPPSDTTEPWVFCRHLT